MGGGGVMLTVFSWVSVLPAPGWRPWYYSYTFPFVYLLLVSVPCLLSFSLSSLVILIPSLRVLVLPGLDWAYWIRTEWGMRGMRIEWVKRSGNLGNDGDFKLGMKGKCYWQMGHSTSFQKPNQSPLAAPNGQPTRKAYQLDKIGSIDASSVTVYLFQHGQPQAGQPRKDRLYM